MTINPDIRHKKVEILVKDKLNIIKIEYNDCWIKLHYDYLLVQVHNNGNSFTTNLHRLDDITSLKTDN